MVDVQDYMAFKYLFIKSKSLMSRSASVLEETIGKSIDTVPDTCTDVCFICETNFSMFLRVYALFDYKGR